MIKQILQNLVHSNNLAPRQIIESQYLLEAGDTGLLARTVRGLQHYLAESNRKQAFEAENRKSIEHLHTLSDENLRDIGITRMDISRAVRLGRDNI
jgi:uncharacterized protein YjiS (DUF1127 family)